MKRLTVCGFALVLQFGFGCGSTEIPPLPQSPVVQPRQPVNAPAGNNCWYVASPFGNSSCAVIGLGNVYMSLNSQLSYSSYLNATNRPTQPPARVVFNGTSRYFEWDRSWFSWSWGPNWWQDYLDDQIDHRGEAPLKISNGIETYDLVSGEEIVIQNPRQNSGQGFGQNSLFIYVNPIGGCDDCDGVHLEIQSLHVRY